MSEMQEVLCGMAHIQMYTHTSVNKKKEKNTERQKYYQKHTEWKQGIKIKMYGSGCICIYRRNKNFCCYPFCIHQSAFGTKTSNGQSLIPTFFNYFYLLLLAGVLYYFPRCHRSAVQSFHRMRVHKRSICCMIPERIRNPGVNPQHNCDDIVERDFDELSALSNSCIKYP